MECELRDKMIKKLHTVAFEDHDLNGACMEGLLDALRNIRDGTHEVIVLCASQYLVSQLNAGYFYKWQEAGYISARGVPIRHAELWEKITEQVKRTCWRSISAEYMTNEVTAEHIKG